MPKNLIKRYIPSPEKIKSIKGFHFLGSRLHDPNIWHLHRHSVSKAFAIGLFWMAIPIPSQMLFAAICAILFRANLPLSVVLVWISNPLTMGPIFYFNYVVGTYILGQEASEKLHFELSWNWITNVLGDVWQPLYLGSTLVAVVLAVSGFFVIHILWRLHIIKHLKMRKERLKLKKTKR